MQTLIDIYRASFPANLRFDKASQILHAECYTLCRRSRHCKYIALSEVQRILDRYTSPIGAPWVQMPVIRHVLLLRQINSIRALCTGRQMLYNRNVRKEFDKIAHWVATERQHAESKHGLHRRVVNDTLSSSLTRHKNPSFSALSDMETASTPNASAPMLRRVTDNVLRDRFEKEVMDHFHVATMYQRMVRLGMLVALFFTLLLCAAVNIDNMLALYIKYWLRMNYVDVLTWFRTITERHVTSSDVPPAYRSLLPQPCTPYRSDAGENGYLVNVVEFTSVEKNITVMAVPCPQVATKLFYDQVGALASVCDGVLLEGVSFEQLDRIAPTYFFPLKDSTFPAMGMHHRYLSILRNDSEPPTLYPAGRRINWRAYIMMLIVPFELYCLYFPTALSATKAEASIAWGRLRDTIDRAVAERASLSQSAVDANSSTSSASKHRSTPYVLCVPWTANHIANIEASLIKYGFRVGRVFPLHWLNKDEMGVNFCSYYHVEQERGS